MSAWAIGGAYGISAGLVIYAIEAGIVEEGLHGPLIMLWATVGLVMFAVGAWRRREQ